MKKFLAIVAIASFAVACNNSSESKPATDSPAVKIVHHLHLIFDYNLLQANH